jgi:hypothetical protein
MDYLIGQIALDLQAKDMVNGAAEQQKFCLVLGYRSAVCMAAGDS